MQIFRFETELSFEESDFLTLQLGIFVMEIDKWVGTNGEEYHIHQNITFARIKKESEMVTREDAEEVSLRFIAYVDAHKAIKKMGDTIVSLQSETLGVFIGALESVKLYEDYTAICLGYVFEISATNDDVNKWWHPFSALLSVVTNTSSFVISCSDCGLVFMSVEAKLLFEYLVKTKHIYDRLMQTLPLDLELLENTKQFLEDYVILSQ